MNRMELKGKKSNFFDELQSSIAQFGQNNAFCINGEFYTYHEFAQVISNIRDYIKNTIADDEKIIGIVANDDLETYAAIVALWFEGKAYVPINTDTPIERNQIVIEEAQITTIMDSSDVINFPNLKTISTKKLPSAAVNLVPNPTSETELVYILFTSGTTGKPKGVPITRQNLVGFIDAFWDMDFNIDENDRCLQMFELTFDLSVMSYLVPLLKGACVYTIPKDKIKYSYIFELMEDHELTVALMVPSILHFLRPYFDEIDLPKMKYSLFCGEALHLDITEEWSRCLPNARIVNVYGPTEDTIFCTYYDFKRNESNKSHNGVLSIGNSMAGNFTILVDESNKIVNDDNVGELCLGGIQLTPGYWKNEEKNKESFFYAQYLGKEERFYRTGDLCKVDDQGDLMYLGRKDFQTKIQGFRVELSEIEFYAKEFLVKTNVVVVAMTDHIGNTELGMIIEDKNFDTTALLDYMKLKLPTYMIPKKIAFIDVFPLNVNGKIDRKQLGSLFKN